MDTHWFRRRMRDLGVTQEDLARALNKDRTVVSRMLNGRQSIALNEIQPLATALDVPRFELLFRAGFQWEPDEIAALRTLVSIPPAKRGSWLQVGEALSDQASAGAGPQPEAPEPKKPARAAAG